MVNSVISEVLQFRFLIFMLVVVYFGYMCYLNIFVGFIVNFY